MPFPTGKKNRTHPKPLLTTTTCSLRREITSPALNRNSETAIGNTLKRLEQHQLILCIRESDADRAYHAASAAIRGGIRAVEMTLTTPDAFDVMRQLRSDHADESLEIGAGTVMSIDQVNRLALMNGLVTFIMSPITDKQVVEHAHSKGILAIPGAMTPSEIWHAHQVCGAKLVKVFPISACGGVAFVRALKGPMEHIKLLPTSSVDRNELGEYLGSDNVLAVGVSRQIVDSKLITNEDWDAIRHNAHEWIARAQHHHHHHDGQGSLI